MNMLKGFKSLWIMPYTKKKIWQIFVFNILLIFFINNFREKKKLKANEDTYKNKNNAKRETLISSSTTKNKIKNESFI